MQNLIWKVMMNKCVVKATENLKTYLVFLKTVITLSLNSSRSTSTMFV